MQSFFFGMTVILVFLFLMAFCIFNIWLSRRPDSSSPYSRLPMRLGADLSFDSKLKVLRYLYNLHQYDNRIFEFQKAAVCRETGRIFQNAVDWYGKINLDWTFLQQRYPGKYVSWGSLTSDQREIIAAMHESLEGFQTDFSSSNPLPKAVEAKYALMSPGPLYVDVETNVLLGWKCVPGTELEVLIVQIPIRLTRL